MFFKNLVATLIIAGPAFAGPDYTIELQTVLEHDDGAFLWFHPRASTIPGPKPTNLITLQKHLQQSDYYSGMYTMQSTDNGVTWNGPIEQPALGWRDEGEDVTIAVCDVTPGWHASTGKTLAIGTKVRYREGRQLLEKPQSHSPAYAIYDAGADTWSEWRYVDMPDPAGKYFLSTPGCVQWLVEDDGSLLIPFYFGAKDAPGYTATVMRCRFDGETLTYIEHGSEMTVDVDRGFVEPSLTRYRGKYYLTLRNDQKGYVTTSDDGINFAEVTPWIFDDGEDLGSYNTQQHWVTHSDGLFLVYTRRGADNDHIMRHRAPLFIAEVDPETLRVKRDTERVLISERGATLGNFGASTMSADETWVTVSEGIWNDTMREKGATGATYIARIKWETPNALYND